MPSQKRWASPPHARRRLAEVGAVKVVRDSGHRDVAAKRRYTLRERGLAQARWRDQLDKLVDKLHIRPTKPNCEEWRSFPPLPLFRFRETPKNGASILPNAV